jgi:hypothetical protein
MSLGLRIALGVAFFAAAQAAVAQEILYLRERQTEIPINFEDHVNRAQIAKMVLYVSEDAGKTWQQAGAAYPTDKHFPFHAKADGQYWFALVTVFKDGRLDPPDISAVQPALRMVFDTREPVIKLRSNERQNGMVSVSWQASDDHPLELDTMMLEYREGDGGKWTALPIQPAAATGLRRWAITTGGPVYVRMSVKDKAENVGKASLEIPGESTSLILTGNTTTGTKPDTPPPPPLPFNPHDTAKPPVTAAPTHLAPPVPPTESSFVPVRTNTSSNNPSYRPVEASNTPAFQPVDRGPRVIARSEGSVYPTMQTSWQPPQPAATDTGNQGFVRPRGPLPPLRYANQTRALLNYEISRVGPSGVGAVELWMTTDEGRSWKKFAEDVDLMPPMQIDFPGEGVYGMTMIVRSRANLGRSAPQPGEAPEMRVEVDLAMPFAELYQVEADPQRRDTLVFRWNANDRNLIANPVTVLYSDKETGPWAPVVTDAPNTGRYLWKMPPNLPYMVYLRLEVRDQAGNVGIAQTPKPVLVDLVEPEAKLTGISVPGK